MFYFKVKVILISTIAQKIAGNMDYDCRWCQKEFNDDKGITKDMLARVNSVKDKGSNDIACNRWWCSMKLKVIVTL